MPFSTDDTSNTRFLIAKYIPDLRRLEPRNIGVVVWTDGLISARFLGECEAGIPNAAIPRRVGVRDKIAYQHWVDYWRAQMSKPCLSINGNGHKVSRESTEFLDALKERSKQQFILVDGGFLSGSIDRADIDEVAHDLFESLVDDRAYSRDTSAEDAGVLKKAVASAIQSSGLDRVKGYQTRIPLTFRVNRHLLSFQFDVAVYKRAPRAVFQHAFLTRPTTVNSTAFMFDCLQKADEQHYRLPRDRCCALIRTTPETMDQPHAEDELNKLKMCGSVIDLARPDQAVEDLRGLAASI